MLRIQELYSLEKQSNYISPVTVISDSCSLVEWCCQGSIDVVP